MENNPALPAAGKAELPSATGSILHSVLFYSACAVAIGGAGYYACHLQQATLKQAGNANRLKCEQVVPPKEDPAIGHIFRESVTRLIRYAKS